jgi:hypothetical protein
MSALTKRRNASTAMSTTQTAGSAAADLAEFEERVDTFAADYEQQAEGKAGIQKFGDGLRERFGGHRRATRGTPSSPTSTKPDNASSLPTRYSTRGGGWTFPTCPPSNGRRGAARTCS